MKIPNRLNPYYIPEDWDEMVEHAYTLGLGWGFGGTGLIVLIALIVHGKTGVPFWLFATYGAVAAGHMIYFFNRGLEIIEGWYARKRKREGR